MRPALRAENGSGPADRGRLRRVWEEFQGDEAVKASVLGFVDDSHAAAKLLGDAECEMV